MNTKEIRQALKKVKRVILQIEFGTDNWQSATISKIQVMEMCKHTDPDEEINAVIVRDSLLIG